MVQAIINIDDQTNRILNIIKAKFGLKDKSQAIEAMAREYESTIMEPELRPDYIEKARRIMKQEPVEVGDTGNLRKRIGMG